jgi:maltose O-acetyltransferase
MHERKSEREKMLAGELYFAGGEELVVMRRKARRLTRLFNATTEDESDERRRLLQALFGKIGGNFELEPPFRCDYGCFISVGENFFANFNCVILDCAPVTIGDGVLFGPGVQIYTAYHPLEPQPRRELLEAAAPVTIGDNVWIGGNAIVLPGVAIGENSVIGAGSVVTKNVPPNVVAAGNPCRVLHEI